MNSDTQSGALCWEKATAMMSTPYLPDQKPECALVHNTNHDCDQVAVVYDKGQRPPQITIREVSGSVHTVLADGIAVAVIARASGPALCAEDVLLVERST